MLPKPEKKSRKDIESQQLELDDAAKKVDNQSRKRLYISLLLGLTIGLSFIFWLYRFFQKPHTFSFRFSLPTLSFTLPPLASDPLPRLRSHLQTLLGTSDFSLFLQATDPQSTTFTINLTDTSSLQSIFSTLDRTPSISLYSSSLPVGVTVKENIQPSGHFLLITNPRYSIRLFLRYPSSVSPDILNQVIEYLYWSVANSSS